MAHPETIILTTDRHFLGAHAAQRWQFVSTTNGIYVREHIDQNRLTEEERTQYEEELADLPSEEFLELLCVPQQPPHLWPTLVLAQRYAALLDAEESLAEEMATHHAPMECGKNAFIALETAHRELLKQALPRTQGATE
jgi:hypothetical protein